VYSLEEFANARTHDYLWNAIQAELLTTGLMFGYYRMKYGAGGIYQYIPKSPVIASEGALFGDDRRSKREQKYTNWYIASCHQSGPANEQTAGVFRLSRKPQLSRS
jgi:hypothetical protein